MTTVDQASSSEQRERVAAGPSAGACCDPCVGHHLSAGAKVKYTDSVAEPCAPARGGEMPDIAAAMASCRARFERACRKPAAPTKTSAPPTATEAAGSSEKEV